MRSKQRRYAVFFMLLVLGGATLAAWQATMRSRNTLWRIVSSSCIPAAKSGVGTGRCTEVSIANGEAFGFVVFKDRNGPLQYLLMPTKRVSGIEDALVLAAGSPNYWAEAWRARRWMEVSNGAPVPREAVAITVNSAWGRSQGQLHLHVSCVRADLRAFLKSLPEGSNDAWAPVPGGWSGHPYELRRLVAESLDGQDLFKDVARDHADDMSRLAVAAIATRFDGHDGFWLLRTHVDLMARWLGSIEGDVQDHSCEVVQNFSPTPPSPPA